MATYLQLVNDVLSRLREDEVDSVTSTSYSTLIGKYVNDTKRQVEDAWNWNALFTTIQLTTVAGTSTYTLSGSGYRLKVMSVNNETGDYQLHNVPLKWILHQQQLTNTNSGQPEYYAFKGTSSGNTVVELYSTPDIVETIDFNVWVPQADLSADADILTIPSEAVVAGAFARALVERGEDGGLSSGEAFGLYKGILADQIAIEASRHDEYECFEAV